MQLSTGEIAVELQLLPFFFDNSTDRADLGTQGAAGTVGLGDAGFLLFRIIAQGRTARREAFAAADAEILPDFIGRIGAGKFSRIEGRPFFQGAGIFRDDDHRFIGNGEGPVQRFFHDRQVLGINRADVADAQIPYDGFDIDSIGFLTFQGIARAGVILMARHTCRTVVQDGTDDRGFIIRYFHEGIDACMEEG